jgi:hypothetical protein
MMVRSFVVCSLVFCSGAVAAGAEYLNGIEWKMPPIVKPGNSDSDAPSDAIILFDGKDLSHWRNADHWSVADGAMVCGRGVVTSNEEFGDCQIHIEWSAPTPAKGSGQGRGNSGIFMMGIYEMQILDSYDNETYFDGQAAAVYKQTPPMVNAMRPPGEWNNYDIIWTAPRFKEDGSLESPAYITALHNGILVLNHFALLGDTPFHRPPEYTKHAAVGPITLQDHGNPVRFRNIWVRPIVPVSGKQVRPPFIRDGDKETPVNAEPHEDK